NINERRTNNNNIVYKIETQPDWELYQTYWDWHPSWQNSINSVIRSKEHKVIVCALENEIRIGYGIIYPSGDLPQIAVDNRYRRRGIGTNIVLELIKHLDQGKTARALNIDKSATETKEFLTAIGFEYFISQKEMLLEFV